MMDIRDMRTQVLEAVLQHRFLKTRCNRDVCNLGVEENNLEPVRRRIRNSRVGEQVVILLVYTGINYYHYTK